MTRVAVVTGGAGGIGGAIVEALARDGHRIAVADIDDDTAAQAANRVSGLAIHLDVTDTASVDEAITIAERELGPIDILVNGAGWDEFLPFLETDEAFWDKVVEINFKATLRTCHRVGPGMVERNYGRVVNIASDAARVGSSLEAVYSGAKGAVVSFTKTLAREVARHGVTANSVCPGPTETAMLERMANAGGDGARTIEALKRAVPMRRLGQPEDVAAAVAFLASDRAGFIHRPDALRQRRPHDGVSRSGRTRATAKPAPRTRSQGDNMDLTDTSYEVENGLAWVAIERPERMNAFRARTVDELIHLFTRAWSDPNTGVICLTGAGERAFCAGGDQKQRAETGDYGPSTSGLFEIERLHRLIRDVPKPVIAAVNGVAIGGGHVLHVLCDVTIAADSARFGQVGPRVGSFDAGFGTAYLARVVGEKRAREIWFRCRQYDAATAERWGLVNQVVPLPALKDEVRAWADDMLTLSPTALRFLKQSFNTDSEHIAGVGQLAFSGLGLFLETDEAREGIKAFEEKRPPDFGGYRTRASV